MYTNAHEMKEYPSGKQFCNGHYKDAENARK